MLRRNLAEPNQPLLLFDIRSFTPIIRSFESTMEKSEVTDMKKSDNTLLARHHLSFLVLEHNASIMTLCASHTYANVKSRLCIELFF